MEVNRENMQKWVDALRSGEYSQGRDRLRDEKGGFCCLGVACDLSSVGRWERKYGEGYIYDVGSEDPGTIYMPKPVTEWLGLVVSNPSFIAESGKKISADRLNDMLDYTFAQIADAIERTYLT